MHPNVFLKTLWQLKLDPVVFVAMSFDKRYDDRFANILTPAIESLNVNGVQLHPRRVDSSQTGDSILTEIMDGIAHSQLVLADLSTFGRDSVTGHSFRNGNVMYEVGLALACRNPSEVLLVRDDHERFLFDVSTIPHKHINFADEDEAISSLTDALASRLKEQAYVLDARVQIAVASLSSEEAASLMHSDTNDLDHVWSKEITLYNFAVMSRLLEKQLIRLVGHDEVRGRGAYRLTPLGVAVAQVVKQDLPRFGNTSIAE